MMSHRHAAAPEGGDGGRRRWGRYTFQASVGLGVVGLLAGLLFSTSARLGAGEGERQPDNLRDLVRVESDRLQETNDEVVALRDEVAALLAQQQDPEAEADPLLEHAAGTSATTGPGVTVRLWDAPTPVQLPQWASPDDLVIHQQDIESVMNALWAGGAEALMVQGHRVTMTTSVRCVGNVLLIDGATYSPPYEIAAIGDEDELRAALLESPAIQIYLQYVDALNLGWEVRSEDALEMPADSTNLTMEYAVVPG